VFAKERLLNELNEAINMSPSELRAWLRTDIAPITVATFKEAPSMEQSKKFLRLLGTPSSELSSIDCHFIQLMLHRIKYLKRSKHHIAPTKADWENSLRNLGYDVKKEVLKKQPSYY
tara:strand:+ start:177 stop:527 length:351 start_codon:yes stop_codon:yes gene_type:complete